MNLASDPIGSPPVPFGAPFPVLCPGVGGHHATGPDLSGHDAGQPELLFHPAPEPGEGVDVAAREEILPGRGYLSAPQPRELLVGRPAEDAAPGAAPPHAAQGLELRQNRVQLLGRPVQRAGHQKHSP